MASYEVFAFAALLVVALYIVVRLILTERAATAFKESNRFAAEIVQNAGEGIIVYDRELRFVVWNRFMEDMTGLKAEDVVGRKGLDIFPHLREQGVDAGGGLGHGAPFRPHGSSPLRRGHRSRAPAWPTSSRSVASAPLSSESRQVGHPPAP